MKTTTVLSSAEGQLKEFVYFLQYNDETLNNLLVKSSKNETITSRKPVVELKYTSHEEFVHLSDLLESERLLYKIILTFSHICMEIDSLTKDASQQEIKFALLDEDLMVKGTNDSLSAKQNENDQIILKMSKSMKFLCAVQSLSQRLFVVGYNLLQQCGAYFSMNEKPSPTLPFEIYNSLNELLFHIVVLDEAISHSTFKSFWPIYKRTVENLSIDQNSKIKVPASESNGLQQILMELENLFSGEIYKMFLGSLCTLKDNIGPKGMGILAQQFNEFLRQKLASIEKCQEQNSFIDTNEAKMIIKANVFCVMFHDFCGQIDAKLVKQLLEMNVKHPSVMLIGTLPWRPLEFLKKNSSSLFKTNEKICSTDLTRIQTQYLQRRLQSLQNDTRHFCVLISQWIMKCKRLLKASCSELIMPNFKELTSLFLRGLRYAGQVSFMVKSIINSHITLQVPMARSSLVSICKLIQLLKILKSFYGEKIRETARVLQNILQYLQHKLLGLLNFCKKKIVSSKLHDRNVDSLSAIKIIEKCLGGPPTFKRFSITILAFQFVDFSQSFLDQEISKKFRDLIQRFHTLRDYQQNLNSVFDSLYIYWHQSILSSFMKQDVNRLVDLNAFQSLIETSDDCRKSLVGLHMNDFTLTENLSKSNYEILENNIIKSLCTQIEIFLRLEVHSCLSLKPVEPFKNGINDYRELIHMGPIEISGLHCIVKDRIENYLSSTFYNMTTIALHDWKTYEEMRHLAERRLLMCPVDSYLPKQTIEQGLDILEIMRNIHIFVSKFVYNMNSQIFVEQKSSNKHLDSIGIHHVANSLRTHGTGVINTTVNFTYQFLKEKFYIFSQFLYDEQIRSRLMKELRSYSERKQENSYPLYSYERADAFNKDIKNLGLVADGRTFLDLFREVITQVGNAIGYVRLVRSGCIQANYTASTYLPKVHINAQCMSDLENNKFSDVTVTAAKNLENNINNLGRKFSESIDYLNILLTVFQPFFLNPQNAHLKNFFLIVPPLILNYVEHMLIAKAKIRQKDRDGVLLFDDGFPVGLAYILKLLNQIGEFNSLQWFSTVNLKFENERQKIKSMVMEIISRKSSKHPNAEDEKLKQTLALTGCRIGGYQREFNLFYYKLSSAKIFFQ